MITDTDKSYWKRVTCLAMGSVMIVVAAMSALYLYAFLSLHDQSRDWSTYITRVGATLIERRNISFVSMTIAYGVVGTGLVLRCLFNAAQVSIGWVLLAVITGVLPFAWLFISRVMEGNGM